MCAEHDRPTDALPTYAKPNGISYMYIAWHHMQSGTGHHWGVMHIVEPGVIHIVEQGVIHIVERGVICIVEWGVMESYA